MFDLTIFPLSLESGREQYELPGLLVMAAPRKAARMRAQDHLLIYCRFVTTPISGQAASAVLTPAQQQEILNKLAETYFAFAGSVTAGLRAVATRLNDFLLNRNLKTAQNGQTVAMLNMAVLHGSGLLVAHAGLAHTFVLSKTNVEHYDDGVSPRSGIGAGRGLGLSRQAIPRFYQASLEPGDLMVICADPPPLWTAKALANSPQLTFDQLRRRLLSDSSVDLQAAVVRFQPGKGQVSYWHPGDSAASPRPSQPRPGLGRAARAAQQSAHPETSIPAGDSAAQVEPIQPAPAPVEPDDNAFADGPAGSASTDFPTPVVLPPVDHMPGAASGEPAPSIEYPSSIDETLSTEIAHSIEGTPSNESAASMGSADSQPLDRTGVFLGGASAARNIPSTPLPRPHRPESDPQAAVTADAEPAAPARSAARRRDAAGRSSGMAHPAGTARPRTEKKPRQPSEPAGETLRKALLPTWQRVSAARAGVNRSMAQASQRLPKRRDARGQEIPFFNIPQNMMLAIALIIPLIVAAVASTVYFRAGRTEQFQALFAQAQQAAKTANKVKDPAQQRQAWNGVYEMVRKAEVYQQTDASTRLKQQALNIIDDLDGFVRLDYQPAVSTGFAADVKISRIVATINDVYLLDTGEGRILRLFRTGTGYEIDPKFICGGSAGKVGTTVLGQLIDMVPMPPSNARRINIMGIDADGNLVMCKTASDGFDSRTLARPDAGWGRIAGMAIYNTSLYVLDPKANAVYRYDVNQDGDYVDKPHLYFDNTIPKMGNVIDLAVDQEFLYLLHSDGTMTVCESGGYSYAATKCTDPSPYGDTRPGYKPAPLSFAGAQFTQIETTQPPDPSIYALDAKNKSIYHLSLRRLNLQRQYLPNPDTDFPLPNGAPTAFTIAPNRRALIAFGNQLFFAAIP